eukprot:scaffold132447_cov33-Tisochrysis_lutea.AAC.3
MQPRLKEGGCIAGLTIIPVSSCSWLQISPTEIGTVGALDLGGASTQITTPLPRSATDNGHAGTISIPLPSRRGKRECRRVSLLCPHRFAAAVELGRVGYGQKRICCSPVVRPFIT